MRDALTTRSQPMAIVWIALAVSQVVYLLIPVPGATGASRMPPLLPLGLGSVALVLGVASVAWLRIRAFGPIRTGRLDPDSASGAAQLFTRLIVAWVLAESIAIHGLVLRFLHFEAIHTLPFGIAAAALLWLGRPWNPRLRRPPSSAELARSGEPLG